MVNYIYNLFKLPGLYLAFYRNLNFQQAFICKLFINYIALHWYYKLFHLLIKNKLNNVYSPADFLKILTEVR